MYWAVLIVSGVFEAVWATALGESDGFSRGVPTAIFLVSVVISTIGLAIAMRKIPVGTAYAAWTGIGSSLAVTFAIVSGHEEASTLKVLFLLGIIGCVGGLMALQPDPADAT